MIPLFHPQMNNPVSGVPALDEPLAIIFIPRRAKNKPVHDGAAIFGCSDFVDEDIRLVSVKMILDT